MNKEHEANREVVRSLYRGILKREPDQPGLDLYVSILDKGEPLEDVVANFVQSDEFRANCGREFDIDLNSVAHWQGFGPNEIEYVRRWAQEGQAGERGFLTDFVGVRTQIDILWDECAAWDGYVHPLPIPMDYHADILEYVGTLRAVDAAGDSFASMELGAGMGPWTVTAGVAARRRGIKDIYLCAVEGDPNRHNMMLQHIRDNGLGAFPQDILQAAVGVNQGVAYWPRLDNPTNQSGARPLTEGSAEDEEYLEFAYDTDDMIRIELVAFEVLLRKRPLWDLLHIDVQGTEVQLCAAAIDELSTRVRYIVIGTHSRKIDGELIELFHTAGWRLENEKPAIINYDVDVPIHHMTHMDGTQIWRNPRL